MKKIEGTCPPKTKMAATDKATKGPKLDEVFSE